jgi:glutamate synthase (NADPH/NADH) small chain
MRLGDPDASGRRRPEPILGSEFVIPADQVIKAIGQEKLVALYDAVGVEHASGYVRTDGELRTSNPKVFAAGDCVRATGQALTVTASEDGKIAARAIARQLGVAEPVPARDDTRGRFLHATVNEFGRIHG